MSSSDYSNKKVKLLTERWLQKAGNETDDGWYEVDLEKGDDAIKYKYYNGNTEWNFFAYRVVQSELYDWVGAANYSTITVKFAFERNSPYYTLTLIIPIVTLTLLAPIGLIIPGMIIFCIVNNFMFDFSRIGRKIGISSHTIADSCDLHRLLTEQHSRVRLNRPNTKPSDLLCCPHSTHDIGFTW